MVRGAIQIFLARWHPQLDRNEPVVQRVDSAARALRGRGNLLIQPQPLHLTSTMRHGIAWTFGIKIHTPSTVLSVLGI